MPSLQACHLGVLLVVAAVAAPVGARAQDTIEVITVVTTSLRGTVRDVYGRPVPDAELVVPRGARMARSRADGSYHFPYFPEGRVQLHVRKIGFQPALLSVEGVPGRETTMDVELRLMATDSTSLARAGAQAQNDWNLVSFHNRRLRGSAGRFYTGQELDERDVTELGTLLHQTARPPRCWNLYLDGHAVRLFAPDVDRTVTDLEGLEIYDDGREAPDSYRDRHCGVVLAWREGRVARRP